MRWLQAVLISLLVLGQVHLCQASYTLPDGQVCLTCPTLTDTSFASNKHEAAIEAPHGDCHDCCSVKDCDGGGHAQKAKPLAPISIDICLPAEPVALALPSIEIEFQEIPHVESAPTHGPPVLSVSRGPPCLQLA